MKLRLFSLANILTLINAFFGCCCIVMLFSGNFSYAVGCVVISLVADFLDGFAARKFGSSSELGKQLDSLADMISFGFVPGAAIFMLLNGNNCLTGDELFTSYGLFDMIRFAAFFITVFSVLRLAKFNIDERQSDRFVGLATPANTLFWIGYVSLHNMHLFTYTGNIFVVLGLIGVSCFLLIAEIPMFSFKFKNYGWKGNEVRYIFILVSIPVLLFFKVAAFCILIPLYVVISCIENIFFKKEGGVAVS